MIHSVPYILNILILTPALVFILLGKIRVFPNSRGLDFLEVMAASLWFGVLMASCVALLDPVGFWPILVFQVLYNVVFGAVWLLPAIKNDGLRVVPLGVILTFVVMLLAWPVFIALALVA